jgi:hypothetical protein
MVAIRAQVHREFIERLASQEQLQSYLASKDARRLLSGEGLEESLREKISQAVQTGSVLTVLGFALAACRLVEPRIPVAIGIVVGGLGIGFLVAAKATHTLYRKWATSEPSSDLNAR